MKSFQQASFNSIPSGLSLGAPIADISQGWDGTLWAIDTNGAPHAYDPIQGVWNAHGTGIDTAALVGTSAYHFRGPEVVACEFGSNQTSAPTLISENWSGLPCSFQLGVHGAANVNGTLYLFGRGLDKEEYRRCSEQNHTRHRQRSRGDLRRHPDDCKRRGQGV
jgi:hypothetical protein